jgi:hypothetical protein
LNSFTPVRVTISAIARGSRSNSLRTLPTSHPLNERTSELWHVGIALLESEAMIKSHSRESPCVVNETLGQRSNACQIGASVARARRDGRWCESGPADEVVAADVCHAGRADRDCSANRDVSMCCGPATNRCWPSIETVLRCV